MIKFFRKIRYDLMEKNKTGKPAFVAGRYLKYAIGEIILVVIGILIALQINTWNEEHKESRREQVVLKQLLKDFEANDSIINKGFKEYDELIGNTKTILRHTGPNVTVPQDSRTRDSLFYLNYPNISVVSNTLNSNSEQINLLSNENLKITLSKFPSIYINYKEVESEIKNHTIAQRAINKQYIPIIVMDSDFNQENFKSDLLGFLRDREFQNTTVDKLWNTQDALKKFQMLHKQNQIVLELIKKELQTFNND
jgi:hypothetical protein